MGRYRKSINEILMAVSFVKKIKPEVILSKNRKWDVAYARHLFHKICKVYKYKLREIGEYSDRVHGSVQRSIASFDDLYMADQLTARIDYDAVLLHLKGDRSQSNFNTQVMVMVEQVKRVKNMKTDLEGSGSFHSGMNSKYNRAVAEVFKELLA